MPIQLTCACGKALQIGEQHAGGLARCPTCSAVVRVPSQVSPPTPTIPVVQPVRPPQYPMPPAMPLGAPPPYPQAPPAYPQPGFQPPAAPVGFGPDPTVARMWERRVRRMVLRGETRQRIVWQLAEANWSEADAHAMAARSASRERTRAIWMMIGFLAVGILALVISIATLAEATRNGGTYVVWYGGVFMGIAGFFTGLVRLIKIKA